MTPQEALQVVQAERRREIERETERAIERWIIFFALIGILTCAVIVVALIDAALLDLLSVLSGIAVMW